MALNLRIPEQPELKPRITVFGVGGAGGNAVNNMIEKELDGVEFVTANTDAQALQHSKAAAKIQMGVKATEGLGAGARPSVGSAAAEETIEEIVDHLAGAHMCFITAGMGGGTGTGAAPIIAQAARELGVLTVGVVTKPFQFEGGKRMKQADEGIEALQKVVDTLIIIPNQNLFRLANEKTTFTEAFSMADDVLYQGVKGVTDLMVRPGLINLDFADVRAVMDEMGKAMMGTGEADGEDRAIQAAEKAIANPLLDEISLRGAKGVLINITGSHDLTLFELDEAANRIREEVDPDANIIVGSTLDTSMDGQMRVSVVATGIEASEELLAQPVPRRSLAAPLTQDRPGETGAPASVAVEMTPIETPAVTEPSLFEGVAETAPAAPAAEAPVFAAAAAPEPQMEDGLPAPVYQPAPEPAPTQAAEAPAAYTAPTPQAPPVAGTPTPEAMDRLRAAVGKSPTAEPMRAEPAAPSAADKPRFGINSLIGRMTGGAGEEGQQAVRQQPQPSTLEPSAEVDPEQEKIEIPAFLRRQAN
ncbi:cell division protein FtsZ [uncultured Litoreibacter sp.]|uniref:cell division protein FtsZ n=1 Tax=uncultured Litoreibacter sp. TaxID=1392394 RepID=UPI00260EC585|nr:cell division protein FtsZ [uncultured Litoreibacter sp.]